MMLLQDIMITVVFFLILWDILLEAFYVQKQFYFGFNYFRIENVPLKVKGLSSRTGCDCLN